MEEIWKPVAEYDGIYWVSNLGNVKNKDGKMKAKVKWEGGYLKVFLHKQGKQKGYFVHRLVAAAFLGEANAQVNHINNDKADNRVENLEWVSQRENQNHRYLHRELPTGVTNKGKKYSVRFRKNGFNHYLGTYDTPEEASEIYQNHLRNNASGETKYVRTT